MISFQCNYRALKESCIVVFRHYLPVSRVGNLRICCLLWSSLVWEQFLRLRTELPTPPICPGGSRKIDQTSGLTDKPKSSRFFLFFKTNKKYLIYIYHKSGTIKLACSLYPIIAFLMINKNLTIMKMQMYFALCNLSHTKFAEHRL